MKKNLWLSLILILTSPVYANTDDTICTQVIQSAVSQNGECNEFPTPCDVPDDWKKVSSCDMIEDNDFGSSLEEKMNKRSYLFRTRAKAQQVEKKARNSGKKPGIKRRRATSSTNRTKNTKKQKSFTKKNYSVAARNRMKYLNSSKGGYQHVGDTTAEERKERRQATHKIISSANAIRTGKLSNKPKWETEFKYRKTATAGLKRWTNSFDTERRRKSREARKTRIYEGLKLKKIWKGQRIQGDISDSSTTE